MAKDIDKYLTYTPKRPAATSKLTKAAVLAVFNQKGGVGKTTSTVSIAAALAEYGRRVLVVDFDPQGSLTVGMTGNQDISPTMYEVLMGRMKAPEVLVKTRVKGVDLLPSDINLTGVEMQLASEVGREYVLARALDPLLASYDYVLIDCLPSLGLLAVNALSAADGLIVPIQCEFFALKGIDLLEETIEKVQSRINPRLRVVGLLPTMVKAVAHHREVLQLVLDRYGDLVFHSAIPETIKFSETTINALPITVYASKSPGAEAYRNVAAELISRIEVKA